ncbi:hypothetical protein RhoFasB10_03805 [Rhodococcus sp. B10]|nr:hypothetical protein [Rhodococcus sp. B10]
MARYTGFSPQTKSVVRQRSGGLCERCGLDWAVQDHHRRARGMGGTRRASTNAASGCLAVCLRCHNRIESARADALQHGWLVPQHKEPADVPVLYRGQLVLLDDAGGIEYLPGVPDDAA